MRETLNEPVFRYTCDGCRGTVEIIGYDRPEGWQSWTIQNNAQPFGLSSWEFCSSCSAELIDTTAMRGLQSLHDERHAADALS